MKMTRNILILSLINILLYIPSVAKAQVKIGEEVLPVKGAILDLKKTKTAVEDYYLGGLLLPHVEIINLDFIPTSFTDAVDMTGYDLVDGVDTNYDLAGMLVYNTKTESSKGVFPGVYVWDGEKWETFSEQSSIRLNPASGKFKKDGETKSYEVINTSCVLSGNYTHTVVTGGDYAHISPARSSDGKFDLTFDSNTTNADRDAIVIVSDPCGKIQSFIFTQNGEVVLPPTIESTSGAWRKDLGMVTLSATASSTAEGIRWYNAATGGSPIGTGANFAPNVQSWGINEYYVEAYNEEGVSAREKVTATIGCGGYFKNNSGEEEWLIVQCYNLGADETLDPFTPAQGLHGHKYRFGVKEPSLTMAVDQETSTAIEGWTMDNTEAFPMQTSRADWPEENNPCPEGWRMPTKEEWFALVSKATKDKIVSFKGTWNKESTNYSSGVLLGNYLFLPATGVRSYSDGALEDRGYRGYYWTSTKGEDMYVYPVGEASFVTGSGQGVYFYLEDYACGLTVRCVKK